MSRMITNAVQDVVRHFQRDEIYHAYFVRTEPGRIFVGYELALVRDIEGLLWVRFPEVHDAKKVRARMALNTLMQELRVGGRYLFGLDRDRERVTFSHRADARSKWTHTPLGFGHWAPIATSPLAAILAKQVMAGGEQPVLSASNTTTVAEGAPQ